MHRALTWVNGKFLKKKLKKTIIYFLIYIHLHDGKKSKDLTFRGKVTVLMPHQSIVEEKDKRYFFKSKYLNMRRSHNGNNLELAKPM